LHRPAFRHARQLDTQCTRSPDNLGYSRHPPMMAQSDQPALGVATVAVATLQYHSFGSDGLVGRAYLDGSRSRSLPRDSDSGASGSAPHDATPHSAGPPIYGASPRQAN
jgi:hypothetical protein